MKSVQASFERIVRCYALVLLAGMAPALARADSPCGSVEKGSFGPFDYNEHLYSGPKTAPRNGRSSELYMVEMAHLDPFVDLNEKRVHQQGTIVGNLNYTLRAFPNDHRALYMVIEFAERHGGELPVEGSLSEMDWPPTVECYFDRALRWRPRDPLVRQLLGIRKFRRGDFNGAIAAFEDARRLGLKSAELDYNTGLAYLNLQDYTKAKEFAKSAYAGGYPLPGLRNLLTKAGQWP